MTLGFANTVVLAAHPDDETLGAGALLGHCPNVYIIHVTDGAPMDKRLWPADVRGDRAEYAALRRSEAVQSLSLARVPPTRLLSLRAVDQQASYDLVRLARTFALMIERLAPDLVLLHAYEGGHPDHDAACFVAHAGISLVYGAGSSAPFLAEMALYHGSGNTFQAGEFLPTGRDDIALEPELTESAEQTLAALASSAASPTVYLGSRPVRFLLPEADASRKRAMVGCFASQREVLSRFDRTHELFRRASRPPFFRPPHEGALYYEQQGWPMSGEAWRELAMTALRRLELAWD